MARAGKSQWDFGGELFSPAETRSVWSVTDLTLRVKRTVEKEFGQVWVRGEVSNLRLQSSGHAYFVLKDANAQLNCVLFRGQGGADRGALRDGAQMLLGGELTVYEPRGVYQLRVATIELQGVGALQAAFERLKQKLAAEGLFDPARKRTIPPFPRRLGLVTSPTGAAIRDVLHVIGRRFPKFEIVLAPCRVQGEGAAAEIAAAVAVLNRWHATGNELDLILVTRGGGSLEDLWAFNEEVVARALAASDLPAVSAVGHEIDFTIADFVADLRAATPSAAAELITQHYVESRGFVAGAGARLGELARRRLEWARDDWRTTMQRLGRLHPRREIERRAQQLDDAQAGLFRAARATLRERRHELAGASQRLLALRPTAQLRQHRQRLLEMGRRLPELARLGARDRRRRLGDLSARLRLLSPQGVLDRGYSITLDEHTGQVIRAAGMTKPGQRLRTKLKSGEVSSVVNAPAQ